MNEILTLAAAVAGGLLTALGAYVNDRLRARDQLRTRWDDRKIEIYSAFGEAVDDGVSSLIHVADCKETGLPYYGQDLDELLATYRLSKERLRSYRERITLVGLPAVQDLANQIVDQIKALQHSEAAGSRTSDDSFKVLRGKIKELSNNFHKEAARELGI